MKINLNGFNSLVNEQTYTINSLKTELLSKNERRSLNLYSYIEMCKLVENSTGINFKEIALSFKDNFNESFSLYGQESMTQVIIQVGKQMNADTCNVIDMDQRFNDDINRIFHEVTESGSNFIDLSSYKNLFFNWLGNR